MYLSISASSNPMVVDGLTKIAGPDSCETKLGSGLKQTAKDALARLTTDDR